MFMDKMIFREGILNDCKYLDEMLTKLIDDERRNYDSSIEEGFVVKDFYKNMIIRDKHKIYLCEIDSVIVGYIYLIIDKGAKIDALYVLDKYRKMGIASKLLDLAMLYFKEHNVNSVEIGVLSKNIAAKQLYMKYGFSTFKEIMKLEL